MVDYNKPATTYDEQIELLKKRNLVIEDENTAKKYLKSIGYFRLSGYWLTLCKSKDNFKNGASFNQIINIYDTDAELKKLLFGLLEDIEINYRTIISHAFAFHYSPVDHYNKQNFVKEDWYDRWAATFEESVKRAIKRNELFVKHYNQKYEKIFPIWTALEMSSFGDLSKFYNNLKPDMKKIIAKETIGFSSIYLENWLYVLSVIRNMCGHNSRLYDRRLNIKPKLTKKEITKISNSSLFSVLVICRKVSLQEGSWQSFYENILRIRNENRDGIDWKLYGFPENWKEYLSDE
ncbi:Abi family protein [Enterococcus sp. BWR-S5]|uniref:Abi family protein n=1 Tax=Enterococcus sp. BWR-S5 TaxID=2787714 RepID=UPI0019207E6F|nr:Abi family protein [Enterococcus sp. BWR-S5]MBL1225830.1 Abi family protein [Enterococcus sp. BWR-S5]